MLNPDYKSSGEEPIIIKSEDLGSFHRRNSGYEIANKGSLTVALDIIISDDLKKEGNAREFVNRIQNIRKDAGFALTDRIIVQISENTDLQDSLNEYKDYICAEILADSLAFSPVLTNGIQIEVNDAIIYVNVLKK